MYVWSTDLMNLAIVARPDSVRLDEGQGLQAPHCKRLRYEDNVGFTSKL